MSNTEPARWPGLVLPELSGVRAHWQMIADATRHPVTDGDETAFKEIDDTLVSLNACLRSLTQHAAEIARSREELYARHPYGLASFRPGLTEAMPLIHDLTWDHFREWANQSVPATIVQHWEARMDDFVRVIAWSWSAEVAALVATRSQDWLEGCFRKSSEHALLPQFLELLTIHIPQAGERSHELVLGMRAGGQLALPYLDQLEAHDSLPPDLVADVRKARRWITQTLPHLGKDYD